MDARRTMLLKRNKTSQLSPSNRYWAIKSNYDTTKFSLPLEKLNIDGLLENIHITYDDSVTIECLYTFVELYKCQRSETMPKRYR